MSTDTDAIRTKIREILNEQGGLPVDASTLEDDADLFQAGMKSFASVNVMLSLEGEFDVEFPDSMLKRDSFETIDAIATSVETLLARAA